MQAGRQAGKKKKQIDLGNVVVVRVTKAQPLGLKRRAASCKRLQNPKQPPLLIRMWVASSSARDIHRPATCMWNLAFFGSLGASGFQRSAVVPRREFERLWFAHAGL